MGYIPQGDQERLHEGRHPTWSCPQWGSLHICGEAEDEEQQQIGSELPVTEHFLGITHCSESQAHQPYSTCVLILNTSTAQVCAPITSADSSLLWHQGPSKPSRRLRAGSQRALPSAHLPHTSGFSSDPQALTAQPLPGLQRWQGCP